MTHGTIAGILITDLMKGKENKWEKIYKPGRFKLLSAPQSFIKENISVLAQYLKDYPGNGDVSKLAEIQKGEGRVIEINGEKWGAYRDENDHFHIVSAVCTHLQCIVHWNNEEISWDCPCHGSRFTIDGKVMNGPANTDLPYYENSGRSRAPQKNA
jgi:Rieske Fe-S protein